VIPIISPGVGDYSDLTKNMRLGIIYVGQNEDLINDINVFFNDNDVYNRLYQASSQYLWSKYFNKYQLY